MVWECAGPPLLARGMVAAKGTRCGRRLEIRRDVLREVARDLGRYAPAWKVAQVAAGGDWQMLEGLGAHLEGRVFCPDHRLPWDDEYERRAPSTLDEQLSDSLEAAVAAAYARLGLTR